MLIFSLNTIIKNLLGLNFTIFLKKLPYIFTSICGFGGRAKYFISVLEAHRSLNCDLIKAVVLKRLLIITKLV